MSLLLILMTNSDGILAPQGWTWPEVEEDTLLKVLFDAIYDKFIADGGYGLTALYCLEADDEAVYPYATFTLITATTEPSDFENDWENCLIQFRLFSNDPKITVLNQCYAELITAFHKHNLGVEGYETISLVKEVANPIREEKVWQYSILFRILVQKQI